MKLLLIENEPDLRQNLSQVLKKEQFQLDRASDYQEGLDLLEISDYDVILLDLLLPQVDTWTFLEKLRQVNQQVLLVMLTTSDHLKDKVQGLDLGADDYLVKPFEPEELLARLRALLRRKNQQPFDQEIELGALTIHLAKREVLKAGKVVELTAKEYQLLEYLARNKNHILTRQQIRNYLWDLDYEGESNIIDVLIKNIRRKLDDNPKNSLIQTKRGLGYVIREP